MTTDSIIKSYYSWCSTNQPILAIPRFSRCACVKSFRFLCLSLGLISAYHFSVYWFLYFFWYSKFIIRSLYWSNYTYWLPSRTSMLTEAACPALCDMRRIETFYCSMPWCLTVFGIWYRIIKLSTRSFMLWAGSGYTADIDAIQIVSCKWGCW